MTEDTETPKMLDVLVAHARIIFRNVVASLAFHFFLSLMKCLLIFVLISSNFAIQFGDVNEAPGARSFHVRRCLHSANTRANTNCARKDQNSTNSRMIGRKRFLHRFLSATLKVEEKGEYSNEKSCQIPVLFWATPRTKSN